MVKLDKELKPSTMILFDATEHGIHVLHEVDTYFLSWDEFFKCAKKLKVGTSVPYKTVKLRKPPKVKLKKLDEK